MNYSQLDAPRALVSEREQKKTMAKTWVTSELADMVQNIGLSELENCSAPLLAIIVQLRREQSGVDAFSLKQGIIEEITGFEILASKANIDAAKITAIRYIFCAVIDEFILNQQYLHTKNWNEKNDWSRQSLINTFYDDAWGGEKFYEITESLMLYPRENLDCLKLILFFLNLGYEGKYRLLENGLERLALLKEKLAHIVATHEAPGLGETLSPRWSMKLIMKQPFLSRKVLWTIGVLAVLCILSSFLFFDQQLNSAANALSPQLSDLNKEFTL